MKLAWVVGVMILFGCQQPAPKVNRMPVVTSLVPQRAATIDARSVEPVKFRRVTWDYPYHNSVEFEVWASEDLMTWMLATNTLNQAVDFPEKPREFFKVRAVDRITRDYSGWATTGGNTP